MLCKVFLVFGVVARANLNAVKHGYTRVLHNIFINRLIHTDGGGNYIAADVRYSEIFKITLYRSVLAIGAVNYRESNVKLYILIL